MVIWCDNGQNHTFFYLFPFSCRMIEMLSTCDDFSIYLLNLIENIILNALLSASLSRTGDKNVEKSFTDHYFDH